MLPFPPKGLLGPNPVHTMGIGQGSPWMSFQLIAGPLLMSVAATQCAICTCAIFTSQKSQPACFAPYDPFPCAHRQQLQAVQLTHTGDCEPFSVWQQHSDASFSCPVEL